MRKDDDFVDGLASIVAIICFLLLFIGFGITGNCWSWFPYLFYSSKYKTSGRSRNTI